MQTMCGCSERNFENHGCNCDRIVWKRRCICWYEPVRERRRCLCNSERPQPQPDRETRRSSQIEGISLQLTTVDDKSLPAECPVMFDSTLTNNSRFINYNHETGTIEIHKQGSYMIDWNIIIEGSSDKPYIRFGIEVNGEVTSSSTLPLTVGQLNGQALIHVDQIPTTVKLINDSCETVHLSCFTPIANLRIVAVE